jgi:hypothetical protein
MDAHNLADLYDLPTLDWESVRHVMDSGVTQAPDSGGPNRHSSWLTTVDPDGTPHTTAVGALDKVVMKFRRLGAQVEVVGQDQASQTLIDKIGHYPLATATHQEPSH